ncbi:unnamed protein product, partial [Heterosigma akashiwo]
GPGPAAARGGLPGQRAGAHGGPRLPGGLPARLPGPELPGGGGPRREPLRA